MSLLILSIGYILAVIILTITQIRGMKAYIKNVPENIPFIPTLKILDEIEMAGKDKAE